MRHDRYLTAIEWFFRVTSWVAAFAVVSLVVGVVALLVAPGAIAPHVAKALEAHAFDPSQVAGQLVLLLSVVAVAAAVDYALFRCTWKLFRALRTEGRASEGLLSRLTVMSRLFLAAFGAELLAKVVASIMVGGDRGGIWLHVAKQEAVRPDWFGFFYPDFEGMTAFWMFLLCTFLVRFLRRHGELEQSVARLEEEQQLTV
jgi:hypothetical protein